VPRLPALRESDYLLFGVAFILGLLVTNNAWYIAGLAGLGLGLAILRWRSLLWFRVWRSAPLAQTWLIATGVALLAVLYFYLRVPQPGGNDISRIIPRLAEIAAKPTVTVTGTITDTPLLTRSGKLRFFIDCDRYQLLPGPDQPINLSGTVTGKLYVTVPPAQAKGIHPSQTVAITGLLYQPKTNSQPSFYRVFDFRKYLRAEGAFAGLAGRRLKVLEQGSTWGWWAIRERIYQAQLQALGTPKGPVLSAMVLGSRAVPIPFEVADQFRRVGLAHALAASGFQTSLILGAVLAIARPLSERSQFVVGGTALLLFGGLSGFAPSVMRAVLMGMAGLVALVGNQKVKPVPMLLLIALLMLLANPLWIEDLGFQFSFLATLGLIVTSPSLVRALDWLPPVIAALIAVPIAATLWVLPVQLAVFGVFPPYGLLANVTTTFLLSVMTIGGFISGLAALVWPLLGSGLAGLMYVPTFGLLWLVQFFSQLPGSSLAIGAIAAWQIVILYGLIFAVWLIPWWQRRWKLAIGLSLGLVLIPFVQAQTTAFRVTVLEATQPPIMVIQEPGANILINSGDASMAAQSVSSFLAMQGINQIDWAIASDRTSSNQSGWVELQRRLPIRIWSEIPTARSDPDYRAMLQSLPAGITQQPFRLNQEIAVGSTRIKLLRADPAVLQMQIGRQRWLLVNDPTGFAGQATWLRSANLPQVDVLWWAGRNFQPELVSLLKPKVVILAASEVEPSVLSQLQAAKIQVFWTERDGAVRWTAQKQFEANFESGSF
jgi:competence protein ComEC